jgi:SET domain-containing protein
VRENFKSDESFYNFEGLSLNIDGRFLGNRARFINHGANGSENISAKLMTSQDFEYIAFYALKNINPGEELLFNYDGSGELAKKYYDKYPFILKR